MERGFLEVKTCKDIVSARGYKRLITIDASEKISAAVALMKKYNIENIPVMQNGQLAGSISESGLFQKVFENNDLQNEPVKNILEAPYPIVDFTTPVEKLGKLITKENGAVLAKDETGEMHIVTKYDIIQSMGN